MFNVGLAEIAVIAVLGLLVFGPDRLPKAIKTLTEGVRTLRGAAGDATRSLQDAAGLDSGDARQAIADLAELHPRRIVGSIVDDSGRPDQDEARKQASPPAPLRDFDPDAP